MLSVVLITGVPSCSHGRASRYTRWLQDTLWPLPTYWGRSWSPPISLWRDTLPLGCLPATLASQNVLCSIQIILGNGRRETVPISGQKESRYSLREVVVHMALQGVQGPHRRTIMQDTYAVPRNRACQLVMAGVIFPLATNENPDLEQWRDTHRTPSQKLCEELE